MTRHTAVMASFLMETHVMGAGPTGCMVALALAKHNHAMVELRQGQSCHASGRTGSHDMGFK